MNDKSLISVIVPVYNVENYLNKCVDSILNQTYKNLQIILVDDGSSDNSGKICDEYALKDSRIKVIHQKNSGPVRARKTGLEASTGEYIGFVDSDDWIEPNMYEEMLDNLIQTGADFVHTGRINHYNSSISIDCRYENKVIDLPKKDLNIWSALMNDHHKKFYIHSVFFSKLYKRKLIMNCLNEVPDDIYYCEDFIAMTECLMNCNRLSLLKKAYYHNVYRKGSLSRTYNTTFMIRIAKMYEHLEKVFYKYEMYEKVKPHLVKFFVRNMINATKLINVYDFIVYVLKFNEVFINKKIVLYGAGLVGRDYYLQLMSNSCCQVVNWVDKNFDKYNYKDCTVNPVDTLKNTNYDIILIAVKKESTANQIKDELIEMGIDKDKLYWSEPNSLI